MSKPLFNKICIIGTGLMGASIGLAVKNQRLAEEWVGVSRRSFKEALQMGAIQRGYTPADLKDALHGADLVILALPVSLICDFIQKKSRFISQDALVIDVGSTKKDISRIGKKFLKNRFIGCHPMAGSEKTGPLAARKDLFIGSVCFATSRNARVERFWKALGCHVVYLSSTAHDAWVAQASHMPHYLAFSLLSGIVCPNKRIRTNPSLSGYRRLALSDADLWADIFLSNRVELMRSAKNFKTRFDKLTQNLMKQDRKSLVQFIRQANQRSQQLS